MTTNNPLTTNTPFNTNTITITISLFNQINDNQVLPNKQTNTTWYDFKNDYFTAHEILGKKDGWCFIAASFKGNADDDVELVTDNKGVNKTDTDGNTIVKRVGSNIDQYFLLTLDYDDGMSVVEAKEKFKNYDCVIYTTYNHLVNDVEKFRVVILLKSPVTSDDIKTRKTTLLKWAESADNSTFSIGRAFYLPSCSKSRKEHAEIWVNEGEALDLLSFEQNKNTKTDSIKNDKNTTTTNSTQQPFTLAIRELIKKGLKEIGEVKHDPYFKIASSMFSGGMTQQDFIEVSKHLKPHYEQIKCLEQWKSSSKLNISAGYVINLLKEHGISVYLEKPKVNEKQVSLLDDEILLIDRKIEAINESDSLDATEKKNKLKLLTNEREVKERELNEAQNVEGDIKSQVEQLLMDRLIYYVMDSELLFEYIPEQGIWWNYKVSAFIKGEPFLNVKGGHATFLIVLKEKGRSFRTKTISAKNQPDYILNMFRKDHWLQPIEGKYHEVFDILTRSLGDNKAENIQHLKQVLAWKYLNPGDFTLPALVIFGEGGSGRNTLVDLVCGVIYGQNQVASLSQDSLKTFNDQLAGKMIVMFDESIAGKADMEHLKSIIGNKYININTKNVKQYSAENTALYFAGSNGALGAVYLDKGQSDRRFSILRVDRSIINHVQEVKNLNREAAIDWWVEHKHYLTNKEHVAMWLNHIISTVEGIKTTPKALHGEDYQKLIKAQSGPLEELVETVFEHPYFTFISSKECYRLYELLCEEYGSKIKMAKPTFEAKLEDILRKKLPYIVKNGSKKVKTGHTKETTRSGWVDKTIKGVVNISNISFIHEDPRHKGRDIINETPFNDSSNRNDSEIAKEHKKLMDD